jgi:glutathione S-transferase
LKFINSAKQKTDLAILKSDKRKRRPDGIAAAFLLRLDFYANECAACVFNGQLIRARRSATMPWLTRGTKEAQRRDKNAFRFNLSQLRQTLCEAGGFFTLRSLAIAGMSVSWRFWRKEVRLSADHFSHACLQ